MITVLEIIYCQHEITIRCVMSGVLIWLMVSSNALVINFTVKFKIISECISAIATEILYLTLMRVEPMMSSVLPLERSGGFN